MKHTNFVTREQRREIAYDCLKVGFNGLSRTLTILLVIAAIAMFATAILGDNSDFLWSK